MTFHENFPSWLVNIAQTAGDIVVSYPSTDVILPFVTIFIITYLAFLKSGFLGDNQRYYLILAVIIGLSVVIPHTTGSYPEGRDVVEIFNNVLPQVSIALVAFFLILLFIGLIDKNGMGTLNVVFILIAIGAIVFFIFNSQVSTEQYLPSVPPWAVIGGAIALIILFAFSRRQSPIEKFLRGFAERGNRNRNRDNP